METIGIEHVIYAPVPYKGYSFRAKSRKANIDSFKEAFKDWLIPFDQSIIYEGFLEKVLVAGKNKLYLARVFKAHGLDELKRSGVVSHIAEIPIDLLSQNKIIIKLVDSSMADFINKNNVPIGEIDSLEIPLNFEDDIELKMVREKVPEVTARKILEVASSDKFKMFVIYRGPERDILSYGLARFILPITSRGFIVASENIKMDVLLLHGSALIVGKQLPPWARIKGWSIINLEKGGGSMDKTDKSIEDMIRQLYGKGI
jgi:hypothetical protein